MATAAIIGDWKPVENNTSHYSVRETKIQNPMTQPVFPTQPCPGVYAHSGLSFIWHRNSGTTGDAHG